MLKRPLMQLQQSGAALVVALLISALVAVFAVRMGNNYQLNVRRAANVIYSDQATFFLLSAESIAEQLLLADDDEQTDHAGEPWGTAFPPVPIGNGMLAAQPLVDLRGRFNINSLGKPPQKPSAQGTLSYTKEQKMFIRLLQTFPDITMDVQRAQAIADAVIDWVDDDSQRRGYEGAEDPYYADLEPPYRAANTAVRSVSELRLVKGIDNELYRELAPHLCALDVDDAIININSATPNILQALGFATPNGLEPLSEQEIESYVDQADSGVGLTREAFLELEPWKDLESSGSGGSGAGGQSRLADTLIEAVSDYYALSSYAKLGELTLPMRSVLKKKDGKVQVLSRSTGSL